MLHIQIYIFILTHVVNKSGNKIYANFNPKRKMTFNDDEVTTRKCIPCYKNKNINYPLLKHLAHAFVKINVSNAVKINKDW